MNHRMKQLVNSLSKSIDDNENIATPFLVKKLAKAVELYPEDKTIGAMNQVINRMANNNAVFIKKSELKSLYNKLYVNNTKFAELFVEEMGEINNLAGPTFAVKDESLTPVAFKADDEVLANALANALANVFDSSVAVKAYPESMGKKALESVAFSLDSWNLKPNNLTIEDGNDKFIIVRADYETPKGVTGIHVPVELNNGKAVSASIFLSNFGIKPLNNGEIKSYLTTTPGSKLIVSASQILQMMKQADAEKREISDTELALTKLNASRQQNDVGGIIGQQVVDSVADVKLNEMSNLSSFEQELQSTAGKAIWQFGDKVNVARNHIIRELLTFGFKNPQVKVAKSDSTTIFYSVALNAGQVGFTVPVKIANNKIVKPSVMLCNGSVLGFDQDNITELTINNTGDTRAAAVASPNFGLTPSELIENIRQCMSDGNHAKAEDALNVLHNTASKSVYQTGFLAYINGLNKVAHVEHKCTHAMKSKNSEHMVCAQTNLPTHKVYQDKNGDCRPLYRRGMSETYEGAFYNNYKILG